MTRPSRPAAYLDPWRVVDDTRQHVFWTYRHQDPALFRDDLGLALARVTWSLVRPRRARW